MDGEFLEFLNLELGILGSLGEGLLFAKGGDELGVGGFYFDFKFIAGELLFEVDSGFYLSFLVGEGARCFDFIEAADEPAIGGAVGLGDELVVLGAFR